MFGRRNLWHGMFPKSFSNWIFNKYREEAWISKYSSLCTLTLHQMWIEICSTCHESTSVRMRIEDHETIQQNVEGMFNSNVILTQELETHRTKVCIMSSELLRSFSRENYARTGLHVYLKINRSYSQHCYTLPPRNLRCSFRTTR